MTSYCPHAWLICIVFNQIVFLTEAIAKWSRPSFINTPIFSEQQRKNKNVLFSSIMQSFCPHIFVRMVRVCRAGRNSNIRYCCHCTHVLTIKGTNPNTKIIKPLYLIKLNCVYIFPLFMLKYYQITAITNKYINFGFL